MKNGFTLIELLAVIIILAILMVVAVPNVLSTLNDAKEKTFVTQAQSIWKGAEQKFIIDSLTGSQKECYDLSNPLNLGSVSDSVSYVVEMDIQTGKVKSIQVLDTNQNFKATGVTTNGITISVDTSDTALICGGNNGGNDSGSGNGGQGGNDGNTGGTNQSGNLKEYICKMTTDNDNDGDLDYGDIVTCSKESYSEKFYVMPNHDLAPANTVSLFAAKNLNLDLNNPIQSDTAGTIQFSPGNETYWDASTNGEFVYDENASGYIYTETYKSYLTNLGINVTKVTIPSYNQLIELGCIGENYSCAGTQDWFYGEYWVGSIFDFDTMKKLIIIGGNIPIWNMFEDGDLSCNAAFANNLPLEQWVYPIRPVVILPISEIG